MLPFQKNDLIELSITATSSEGMGIGRYQGAAVFVAHAAQGDVLTVRIVKLMKNFAFGKIEESITPSPHRIEQDLSLIHIFVDLRTDSSVNPIGIDNDQPCFSWKMQSNHIGASQSAYQIVVTNPAGETVWDSGKIESGLASLIPYEGDTLQPTTRYDWSVQVWDQDGKIASASAYFETTLTDGNWSEAKWIASPDYTRPNTLAYTAKD